MQTDWRLVGYEYPVKAAAMGAEVVLDTRCPSETVGWFAVNYGKRCGSLDS